PTNIYTLSLHDALPIYERQQVVQRIEAVQCRVANGKAAPQESYNARSDQWDCRKQIGDDRGGPVAHLSPRQHVSHEGCGDQQQRSEEHTSELQSPYDLV